MERRFNTADSLATSVDFYHQIFEFVLLWVMFSNTAGSYSALQMYDDNKIFTRAIVISEIEF